MNEPGLFFLGAVGIQTTSGGPTPYIIRTSLSIRGQHNMEPQKRSHRSKQTLFPLCQSWALSLVNCTWHVFLALPSFRFFCANRLFGRIWNPTPARVQSLCSLFAHGFKQGCDSSKAKAANCRKRSAGQPSPSRTFLGAPGFPSGKCVDIWIIWTKRAQRRPMKVLWKPK